MKRILFVIPAAPLAQNYSGAASRFLQDFRALLAIADEVHVVRVHLDGDISKVYQFEQEHPEASQIHTLAASWTEMPLTDDRHKSSVLSRLWQSIWHPIDVQFPHAESIKTALEEKINELQPLMVWVGEAHLAAGLFKLNFQKHKVYSHTDLLYRVRGVRLQHKNLANRWQLWTCRRAETQIVRSQLSIVTGSYTEVERLHKLGNTNVFVVPTAYENLAPLADDVIPATPRIIHLGSLETTANRVGLESYLKKAHPAIKAQLPLELWVIGDASRVKPPLADLLDDDSIFLQGYVPDLGTALRPFDIAILPYEHDTGYRTKLPLLLGYGQVVVTTMAAVAGSYTPDLERVCIIVEDLTEFPARILQLAGDTKERKRLGLAARAFFETHFTEKSLISHYENILSEVLKND